MNPEPIAIQFNRDVLWAEQPKLLPRDLDGEFAVVNAGDKPFGITRGRVFSVGGDQFGERQEQRGLRQAVPIDTVVLGVHPRLLQITERKPFLLVIGDGLMGRRKFGRYSHVLLIAAARGAPDRRKLARRLKGISRTLKKG